MLRVLLYRAWVWPDKCTVAEFFQRVHNISFFFACKQYTTHSIYVKNGTIQRVASPAHVTLSAPLSFPTSKCNSRQGGMKLQKKKHHRKFPERCAPSKRCEACKKLTQVLCKKTNKKNPEKSHCASRKWREIPSANQRNLKSRRRRKKKSIKRWQCLKKQTTRQFLLVHTRSHKVQGIFTAYQQDNFTTTDCQKEVLKPRSQYRGRFCNQPFFFFVAFGKCKT